MECNIRSEEAQNFQGKLTQQNKKYEKTVIQKISRILLKVLDGQEN